MSHGSLALRPNSPETLWTGTTPTWPDAVADADEDPTEDEVDVDPDTGTELNERKLDFIMKFSLLHTPVDAAVMWKYSFPSNRCEIVKAALNLIDSLEL